MRKDIVEWMKTKYAAKRKYIGKPKDSFSGQYHEDLARGYCQALRELAKKCKINLK